MKVIGYVRVSTDTQDISYEAQEVALRQWCEKHEATLVAMYKDKISSGATLQQRTGLMRALTMAKDKVIPILAYRRDRVARSVFEASFIENKLGIQILVATADAANEATPEAKLQRQMLDVIAEYERDLIRGRIRFALEHKKRAGCRVGRIPYGFRLGDDGLLVRDDGEQEAIAMARELRTARRLSSGAIAEELNRRELWARGRKGQPSRWTQSMVYRLLKREGL